MKNVFVLMAVSLLMACNNATDVTNVTELNSMLEQGYELEEINGRLSNTKVFVLENDEGKTGVILRNGQWLVEPAEDVSCRFRYGCLFLENEEDDNVTYVCIDPQKGEIVCSITCSDDEDDSLTLSLVNGLLKTKFESLPDGCDRVSIDQGDAAADGFCIFHSNEDDTESVINREGELVISGKRDVLYLGENLFIVADANEDMQFVEIK